ncbi:hypothetical protein AX27061_0937 [Achromobacter xylosoxidans NBRC 15126 = ATCC 27061]|nr:hypothetical protein AX27061_0937 [Achromobacter xylosoxidans NBRC 15126 = ATCC 27061]
MRIAAGGVRSHSLSPCSRSMGSRARATSRERACSAGIAAHRSLGARHEGRAGVMGKV